MKRTEMQLLAATVTSLCLLASACAHANQARAASGSDAPSGASPEHSQTISVTRSGSQPSRSGPAQYFTGSARIEPLFDAHEPSRTTGGRVTFQPGARTAWHTHPLGQTLIVTAGTGWIQQEGGPIEEIREGDVVWIPPATKHWHGATPTTAMTHIAIQEEVGGKNVEWMEQVSEEEYKTMDTKKSDALASVPTLEMFGWSHRRSRGTGKAFLAICGNALI